MMTTFQFSMNVCERTTIGFLYKVSVSIAALCVYMQPFEGMEANNNGKRRRQNTENDNDDASRTHGFLILLLTYFRL